MLDDSATRWVDAPSEMIVMLVRCLVDLVNHRQIFVPSLPQDLIDSDRKDVGHIAVSQVPSDGPLDRAEDLEDVSLEPVARQHQIAEELLAIEGVPKAADPDTDPHLSTLATTK